jgi:hypothetical protein
MVGRGERRTVSGGARSTIVHSWIASFVTTPSSSVGLVASTVNVCGFCSPASRPSYVHGEVHGFTGALSSEQLKVAVGSVDENLNMAVVDSVPVVGASVIATSGATSVPTSHVNSAGDASGVPPAPTAMTSNRCSP